MHIRSFRLQLNPGQAAEYQLRHKAIWPELTELLQNAGIEGYWIFLDDRDDSLYAVMQYRRNDLLDMLPASPVMRSWWAYMSDIMQTQSDKSPVSTELRAVFEFSIAEICAEFRPEYPD